MANKIWTFDNPNEYVFDSNKIAVSGGLATLKEDLTHVLAWFHLDEATGSTVIDSGPSGYNGTPVNNPTSITGKLGGALSFNGTNQYTKHGNVLNFNATDPFSIEFWMKTTSTNTHLIISKAVDGGTYRGWYVMQIGNTIYFRLFSDAASAGIKCNASATLSDGNWHHVVITYDGSCNANNVKFYVDNVLRTTSVTMNSLSPTDDTTNTVDFQLSGRDGTNYLYTGELDEVVIYDYAVDSSWVNYRWNAGNGTIHMQYYTDEPTIYPVSGWSVPGVGAFVGFSETLGGSNEGNIAYQLSDDNSTWYYWNGSDWVVASGNQYNSANVVNDNIDQFPTSGEYISFKAFLKSNGEQQVELDSVEITANVGQPPSVYAGTDKSCYDHQTIKPYSDAIISDPDGDIENATAWSQIESSNWVQIQKGGYGTLQEAIRNYEYTFDNVGSVLCRLKIIDEQSREQTDDLYVTVNKYSVTFNVKNKDGEHLPNIKFNPGDGTGWTYVDSPFTWEYEYSATPYTAIIDKCGYSHAIVNVESTNHTENVTLHAIYTAEEIAEAVWDVAASGHTTAGTFGQLVNFINDIEGGRWKIDTATNEMIFYAADNTTEVAKFKLYDDSGAPSSQNVFERRRQ
ncbi:MAG: hypothetical protein DRI44_08360 [Chlamydiae bacterium]|nr:MAG: hypothetical protein DRI44_08360 [Chlamydiota bacterium]